jgi:hypothetical protein
MTVAHSVEQATRLYLLAKEASAQAEAQKKEAEQALREALAIAGISASVVDGIKVAIVEGERKSYDADKLAMLVKPATYKKVTKPVVDGEMLASAVSVGIISQEVADTITKVTTYSQVRTTAVSPDAKAKSLSDNGKAQVA